MKKLKIKVNFPYDGNRIGEEIIVNCDDNDVPKEQFWRRRLEEAKRNNCVEIVQEKKAAASSSKVSKSKSNKE